MKRPFAILGISYLVAQTVAVSCEIAVNTVFFFMAMLCVPVLLFLIKSRPVWVLPVVVSCAICFGVNIGYTLLTVRPALVLEGQRVHLTGKVVEAPVMSYGRYQYVISSEKIDSGHAPDSVRFRLSSSKDIGVEYGDKISTTVLFNYRTDDPAVSRRLLSSRVPLTAHLPYGEEPEVIHGDRSLYGSIIDLREKFASSARIQMGEELGGLVIGMFTGDTSGIDDLTLADFRACGLSHLFSVSGMHLSVLCAALLLVLRLFVPNYRVTSFLCIPFVLFFMAFSGFSMSVRRAGIMLIMTFVADLIKRESDALNSLGVAALVICLTNPFAAADVGMLMSFASTAGIILFYKPLNRKARDVLGLDSKSRLFLLSRPLLSAAVTSVIAAAVTFPICALSFGEVSLISPLSNVLCVYPAAVFMISGSLAAILYSIPVVGPVLGFAAYIPAWITGRLTIAVTGLLSRLPGAGVSMNYSFLPAFFVLGSLLLMAWFLLFGKDRNRLMSLMVTGAILTQLFMFGFAGNYIWNSLHSSVVVCSAENGLLTALISGDKCILIGSGGDGYTNWKASGYLAERNITDVAAVFLPDNSDYYADNALDNIEMYEPDYVYLSPKGSRYELIEQTCVKTGSQMFDIHNALYSDDKSNIDVRTVVDEIGEMWIWCECDDLSMLVCPEGGDCRLLPEEFRKPDVALLASEDMINITYIDPITYILSMDSEQGRKAVSVLEYRGVDNVFATNREGYIMIEKDGRGIRVLEQD